jgi:hypothetical protein
MCRTQDETAVSCAREKTKSDARVSAGQRDGKLITINLY